MTVNRGLFVKQNGEQGTTPLEGRRALAGLFAENAPGKPRSGLLNPATASVVTGTSSMAYTVAPVVAVVNRADTEGVYVFSTTGSSTVNTTAAPGTDKRWDLIWIRQMDVEKSDTLNGSLSNQAVLGVTQGSVAASPAKPTSGVPAGALVIAEALVGAGTTATNQSTTTITQTWVYAALRGTPIWVRGAAERNTITSPTVGMRIHNLSTGWEERWDGKAWEEQKPPMRAAIFTTSQTGVPSNKIWGPGMPDRDPERSINQAFAFFSENDWISVLEEGIYAINFLVEITGGFGDAGFVAIQNLQGEVLGTAQGTAVSGGLSCSAVVWLKPGTQIPAGVLKFLYLQNNGKASSSAKVRIQIAKVG